MKTLINSSELFNYLCDDYFIPMQIKMNDGTIGIGVIRISDSKEKISAANAESFLLKLDLVCGLEGHKPTNDWHQAMEINGFNGVKNCGMVNITSFITWLQNNHDWYSDLNISDFEKFL